MSKKIISHVLTLIMVLGLFCLPAVALEASELGTSAVPTASTVLVNGESVAFDAYNIGGNNYFKLRDLAYTLNGTAKQFNVGWDGANNAITLASGQGYTAVGGEMSGKGGGAKTAVPTTSKIIKDGNTVSFTAYNIDGNNYFKLRDIGEAFDFGVDWDGAKNTIVIDTGKGYSVDVQTPTITEPTKPTDPPSRIASSGMPKGNSGIVGIWVGLYNTVSVGPQYGLSVRYRVFYEDGTFRAGLPSKGLIDFDLAEDKKENPDFWGTYTMGDNTGTWKISYSEDVHNLMLEKDSGLNIGSTTYTTFYRCISVDNYKLDGSYTSHYDTLETFMDYDIKPIIHFKSDGTFIDEGVIHYGAYGYDENENRPGSGSYELKDFTLTLRYSDGRIKQIACSFGYGLNNNSASEYFIVNNGSVLVRLP